MRVNLHLTPEEEKILLEAIAYTQKQGFPATPTKIVRTLFWAGIREYQAQGKLPSEPVSGALRTTTLLEKTISEKTDRENDFEQLFQIFTTQHPKLVDKLMSEYPQEYDQVVEENDEVKFEEWVREKFRLRKDYQAKIKPLTTHQPNGE